MGTRLLDWTDNALAALWFAVQEVYLEDEPNPLGVVWALTPEDGDFLQVAELEKSPFGFKKKRYFCQDTSPKESVLNLDGLRYTRRQNKRYSYPSI
jgi:hypothetical protein